MKTLIAITLQSIIVDRKRLIYATNNKLPGARRCLRCASRRDVRRACVSVRRGRSRHGADFTLRLSPIQQYRPQPVSAYVGPRVRVGWPLDSGRTRFQKFLLSGFRIHLWGKAVVSGFNRSALLRETGRRTGIWIQGAL